MQDDPGQGIPLELKLFGMEKWEIILPSWFGYAWVQVALVLAGAYVVAKVADWVVTVILKRLTAKTRTDLDDKVVALLHGPIVKTILLIGLGIAVQRLAIGEEGWLTTLRFLQTFAVFVWTIFLLKFSALMMKAASSDSSRMKMVEPTTYPLFDNLAKLVLVALALYVLIGIWDWDATGWVASAGILGLAVSFAAKDSLANLFSGVFIIADAPFRVGDYILLDTGERGEVVHIGLRSTRILTRDDVEVSIPNGILGNTKIVNETGGPAPRQRVRVQVGVSYDSDLDQVREVLMKVAEAVDLVLDTPEPRVRFRAFGDSSLAFELLVWVAEPSVRGMALDALNTAVHRAFSEAGVQIPFPQRDLRILEGS